MRVVLSVNGSDAGLQAPSPVTGRHRQRGRLWVLGLAGLLGIHCGLPQADLEVSSLQQALSVALTDCQPASLVQAITNANGAGAGSHTITLMGGCTYSLTSRNNDWYGPNALPPIQGELTIDGGPQGAVIERSPALGTPT